MSVGAVRVTQPFATLDTMEETIKKWLRNARDLSGGRIDRPRKKKCPEVVQSGSQNDHIGDNSDEPPLPGFPGMPVGDD